MKVFVACEFSGVVRDAFSARGHDVISCDLLPSELPGRHLQMDIFEALSLLGDEDWRPRLLVGHPPCRYLTNSGVRWLHTGYAKLPGGRWDEMRKAAEFFKKMLALDIPHIALENPILHKYALEIVGRKYDQIIQPWQFGHGETKATCLWLKNLPKLQPTNVVGGREHRVHRELPSEDRWKNRSRTLTGIAEAMAEQWGSLQSSSKGGAPALSECVQSDSCDEGRGDKLRGPLETAGSPLRTGE